MARCTVERLMADFGLQGVIRGKPVRTTVQDKAAPCPLDHVNRVFHAPAPIDISVQAHLMPAVRVTRITWRRKVPCSV